MVHLGLSDPSGAAKKDFFLGGGSGCLLFCAQEHVTTMGNGSFSQESLE